MRMPWRCASTMPAFTSRVKPKSSAFTIRRMRRTFAVGRTPFRTGRQLGCVRNFFGFLWDVRQQAVQFAGDSGHRIVQLRIHHQLADGSLARIDLVDGDVDLLRDQGQLLADLFVLQQFAGCAFARVQIVQHLLRFPMLARASSAIAAGSYSSLPAVPLACCTCASMSSSALNRMADVVVKRVARRADG